MIQPQDSESAVSCVHVLLTRASFRKGGHGTGDSSLSAQLYHHGRFPQKVRSVTLLASQPKESATLAIAHCRGLYDFFYVWDHLTPCYPPTPTVSGVPDAVTDDWRHVNCAALDREPDWLTLRGETRGVKSLFHFNNAGASSTS